MLKISDLKKVFKVKTFCEKQKIPIQEKRLEEFTYHDLKDLIFKTDSCIENGTYFIDSIPDNNYFSEVPIYIAPQGCFNNDRSCEPSSILFTSTLTSLAWFKVIFTHWFFFPFFGLMTLMSASRFSNANKMHLKYILRISLIDENKVRIIYYNGTTEEVSLKNINISSTFQTQINKLEEKKKSKQASAAADTNNLNKNMNILITIDTFKNCTLVLRNSDMSPGKLKADNLAYIDNKLLFGIINKKTKRLSLNE
jgi:hypothetical protein